MAADQMAALADRPLSRPLARARHALPHAPQGRSGGQSRPAHRRRRPHVHQFDAGHRHLAARLDRHAGFLRGDPVEPVGGHAADDRVGELQHPWLSRLGGADLRHYRDLGDPSRRPAAGQAQFRSAALRGRFPFLAGTAARERRGSDTTRGRGCRGRAAARSLLARGRELVRHHAADQAAHLLDRRLFPSRHHLPVPGGKPGLFLRRAHARRADADRFRLRPGAERALLLRHRLFEHRRLEGRARPAGRIRGVDRLGGKPRQDRATGRVHRRRRHARSMSRSLPSGCRVARRSCGSRTSASSPAIAFSSRAHQAPARRACSARSAGFGRSAQARSAFPRERACWCCRSALICRSVRCAGRWPIPDPRRSFPARAIEEVVEAVGLGDFSDRLDETAYWADKLSGGEQQRLSIARALLQKPQWLFLDEATSALDETAEAELYRLLLERLPNTAIISIGHRSSLVQFHGRFFELKPEAPGRHRLAETGLREDAREEDELGDRCRLSCVVNRPTTSPCSRSMHRARPACPSRSTARWRRTVRSLASPW